MRHKLRNIKLIIEYDGTNYLGWQKQPRGITVQEALQSTLEKILKDKVNLIGSGRTDSGVHALAQVANFKTNSTMTTKQFQKALNSFLPKDIIVRDAQEVDLDFHSQYHAKSKIYVYKILNRSYPSALRRSRVWFVPHKLNYSLMRVASKLLLGKHDFKAFTLKNTDASSTLRTVLKVGLEEKAASTVEFEIEATGFLKRMVRLIVGTLVQVGKEKVSVAEFKDMLDGGQKNRFARSAPPSGLFLKEVRY
jgi:tRNA pseudouridine38-40 synthase